MLEGQYNFLENESAMLKFWQSDDFFKVGYNPKSGKVEDITKTPREDIWALVCPPPNAYGNVHIGNLSGYVVMDMMARFQRMNGKRVILLPGKDHAGLEGEAMFIKEQLIPNGQRKTDFEREEFYKMLYAQQEEYIPIIRSEEQGVGLSADFSKDLYTLDPSVVEDVLGTFLEAFEKGKIYKDIRIVNWDPASQSTLSDSQCEREERDAKLFYVKYKLINDKTSEEFLTVATSRPETIFGDTALVVNPTDERYKDLIGRRVLVPGTQREVPIISSGWVEKEFGTGILKLTPAHANDDYRIMNEWNDQNPDKKVGYINVINRYANLDGPVPEKYKGLKAKQVRELFAEELSQIGLLEKTENIKQNVVISERTKAVVEPIMASQWYLKVDDIKEELKDLVKKGELTLHPAESKNSLFAWIDNLHDWGISRSLWWGYRLPVWYAGEIREGQDENGQVFSQIKIDEVWHELDINNKDHVKVQIKSPGENWIQDEDVLDTWFSSGQWPYLQLKRWGLTEQINPIDCMVNAVDLLNKWDLAMMELSLIKGLGSPFKNLYLTGTLLGADNRKMSKSKGNAIYSQEIREKYGVDAYRMNCLFQVAPNAQYKVNEGSLKGFRNFNNKLWNASKFVFKFADVIDDNTSSIEEILKDKKLAKSDKEFLKKMILIKEKYIKNMEEYKFWIVTEEIYLSFWNDFCDKYLEDVKSRIGEFKDGTYSKNESDEAELARISINLVLDEYLKMLHPYIPFITERIWREKHQTNIPMCLSERIK